VLRLSESELAAALAGLSPAERVELLDLLEERERIESEKPIDNRYTIEQMLWDRTRESCGFGIPGMPD
jgi:hypothetical protein